MPTALQGLGAFLIRFFGIILAYYCFVRLVGLVLLYRMLPEFNLSLLMIGSARLALMLTPFVMVVSCVVLMIWFPVQIFQKLIPTQAIKGSFQGLDYLAVTLLAFYIIVDALLYGTDYSSRMVFLWSASLGGGRGVWTADQLAQLAWFVLRFSTGLWCLLNSDRIVGFWQRELS